MTEDKVAKDLENLFHIVKCMECGSLDEVWEEPDDLHICADCEDATYICLDCGEIAYDCDCIQYCQYCSNDEEYCDCLRCEDCGMIVYECGCEEGYTPDPFACHCTYHEDDIPF